MPLDPASSESRAPTIVAVESLLLALTVLVLCARVYSRFFVLKRVGPDDWTILVAGAFMISTAGVHIAMVKYGAGKRMKFVHPDEMVIQYRLGSTARLLYLPNVALIRISILLFMRRLSPKRLIRLSSMFLIVLNIVITIAAAVLLVFRCSPPSVFFKLPPLWPPHTKCVGGDAAFEMSIPVISAVLDFAVWLVPAVMISTVQFLGWRQKLMQIFLLGMGLLACIPSALRIPKIDGVKRDMSWHGTILSIYHIVEVGVGIIAASLPALYPLIVGVKQNSRGGWSMKKNSFWSGSGSAQPYASPPEPRPAADVALRNIRVPDLDEKGAVKYTTRRHSSIEQLYSPRSLEERECSVRTDQSE